MDSGMSGGDRLRLVPSDQSVLQRHVLPDTGADVSRLPWVVVECLVQQR